MCIPSHYLFNSRFHCVKNKGKEEMHSLRIFWVWPLLPKAYKQCDRGFVSPSYYLAAALRIHT